MAGIDESLDRVDAAMKRLELGLAKSATASPADAAVIERKLDALSARVERALSTARAARAALEASQP